MTSDRIEEIIKQTAYPESMSVLSGMKQIWNEMQQEFNSRTCKKCKHNNSCEMQYVLREGVINVNFLKDFGCNKFERKQ